jgi:ATP-binding protein involved in chromosome partitioning
MSYFVTPGMEDNVSNRQYIFGKEGGKRLAEEYEIPYLGNIPLIQTIREGGDSGVPVMMTDDELSRNAFMSFAGTAARSIAMRNANMSNEKRAEVVEM